MNKQEFWKLTRDIHEDTTITVCDAEYDSLINELYGRQMPKYNEEEIRIQRSHVNKDVIVTVVRGE